jgi:hypothetical protein
VPSREAGAGRLTLVLSAEPALDGVMMSVVEQPGFRGRIVPEPVGIRVFLFSPGVEDPAAVAGKRPKMIVADTASYSDIVFGLLTLAGFAYAPQLADLPGQKMWRIDCTADYGAFQDAARGRIDLARIERHWQDILRIIGSIHAETVRAYDVIRMLSRDGRLHDRQGQIYQRCQDGVEDQIGALGLVLNALVLFTTRYMDAAVNKLRADGFDLRDEDVARLSPFVRHHINMLGRYSFQLPDLPGGLQPLRDPPQMS